MANPAFGGDEVNAIVIDVGSHTCKAGYAGEDTPKVVFETVLGEVPEEYRTTPMDVDAPKPSTLNGEEGHEGASRSTAPRRERHKRGLRVLRSAHTMPLEHQEVRYAMENGVIRDWDLWGAVVDEALTGQLRVQPGEHPLLVSEPTYVAKADRERVVEHLFETFDAPAGFLAKSAVLASFSLGRQTALIVDIGHQSSTVAAVHDGFALHSSIKRSPLGGHLLTKMLYYSLKAKGGLVRPWYQYSRAAKPSGAGTESVVLDLPKIAASQLAWARERIVADIKETTCRTTDVLFVEEDNANMPTSLYELPDGSTVEVGVERFKVPEALFNPAVLTTIAEVAATTDFDGKPLKSIAQLVIDSVDTCDVDLRKELFNGVVLCGGSSLFGSTKDRLERDLLELAPQAAKVKVAQAPNAVERKFAVWIGGSILGCLGTFHQLWMSKQEFEEHGASLIHRKSP